MRLLFVEEALPDKGVGEPFARAYQLQNIEISSSKVQGSQNVSPINRTADAHTVSDLLTLVNRYDPEFKPHEVNPVFINEYGTSEVFRHGTGEGFTKIQHRRAFDPEQIMRTDNRNPTGDADTISHAGDDRLSEFGLANIGGLIENAILLDSEVHEHHSKNATNDFIAFDHKLYAFGSSEKAGIALYKITVEEYFQSKSEPQNKRFHNLKFIEKIADNVGGRTSEKSRSGGSTSDISTINYTVADLFAFVKEYDPEFKPHEVNLVFINEYGTSEVFRRGTGEGFTKIQHRRAFDPEQVKRTDNRNPTGSGDIGFRARRSGKNFRNALSSKEWYRFYRAINDPQNAGQRIADNAVLLYNENNINNAD